MQKGREFSLPYRKFLRQVCLSQAFAIGLSPFLPLTAIAQPVITPTPTIVPTTPGTGTTTPTLNLPAGQSNIILPTDLLPLTAGQERIPFAENLQLRLNQLLPARFYFSGSVETSLRLETNPFQFPTKRALLRQLPTPQQIAQLNFAQQQQVAQIIKQASAEDMVFRVLPNVTAGWTITPRTRLFGNYFLIRDQLRDNTRLNTLIQSYAWGLQQDFPVGQKGNLQAEMQFRELNQTNQQAVFDFLPGLTFSYILNSKTVLFANALLQMRGKKYFQAPTKEIDPFYTGGILHSRGGWTFAVSTTFVQNFREPFRGNATLPFNNYAIISDFEISRRLFRQVPGLQAFVRAEPIFNFHSANRPGLAGTDFRLFGGMRFAVAKPALTATMNNIIEQLRQQENETPGNQTGPKPSAYLPDQVIAGLHQPIHGSLSGTQETSAVMPVQEPISPAINEPAPIVAEAAPTAEVAPDITTVDWNSTIAEVPAESKVFLNDADSFWLQLLQSSAESTSTAYDTTAERSELIAKHQTAEPKTEIAKIKPPPRIDIAKADWSKLAVPSELHLAISDIDFFDSAAAATTAKDANQNALRIASILSKPLLKPIAKPIAQPAIPHGEIAKVLPAAAPQIDIAKADWSKFQLPPTLHLTIADSFENVAAATTAKDANQNALRIAAIVSTPQPKPVVKPVVEPVSPQIEIAKVLPPAAPQIEIAKVVPPSTPQIDIAKADWSKFQLPSTLHLTIADSFDNVAAATTAKDANQNGLRIAAIVSTPQPKPVVKPVVAPVSPQIEIAKVLPPATPQIDIAKADWSKFELPSALHLTIANNFDNVAAATTAKDANQSALRIASILSKPQPKPVVKPVVAPVSPQIEIAKVLPPATPQIDIAKADWSKFELPSALHLTLAETFNDAAAVTTARDANQSALRIASILSKPQSKPVAKPVVEPVPPQMEVAKVLPPATPQIDIAKVLSPATPQSEIAKVVPPSTPQIDIGKADWSKFQLPSDLHMTLAETFNDAAAATTAKDQNQTSSRLASFISKPAIQIAKKPEPAPVVVDLNSAPNWEPIAQFSLRRLALSFQYLGELRQIIDNAANQSASVIDYAVLTKYSKTRIASKPPSAAPIQPKASDPAAHAVMFIPVPTDLTPASITSDRGGTTGNLAVDRADNDKPVAPSGWHTKPSKSNKPMSMHIVPPLPSVKISDKKNPFKGTGIDIKKPLMFSVPR